MLARLCTGAGLDLVELLSFTTVRGLSAPEQRGADVRRCERCYHRARYLKGKMSALWPDTDPDVERLQVERLRQTPDWRKMALMAEMGQSVRTLALAGLRQRYPTDSPGQRRRRLADLLLGPDLAARAYGPAVEEG